MRPKLKRSQVVELSVAHLVAVDAIARGDADEAVLWQWAGGLLTWWQAAQLSPRWTDEARAEMRGALDLVQAVAERWIATGRVGFSGPQLQQARDLCALMDAMAEEVDLHVAMVACEWGANMLNAIKDRADSVARAKS
jgi:hypothetical protein